MESCGVAGAGAGAEAVLGYKINDIDDREASSSFSG